MRYVLLLSLFVCSSLVAQGKGLHVPSKEALEAVENNWHHVIDVKPNKVGAERMKDHRTQHGLPPVAIQPVSHQDEIVHVVGKGNIPANHSHTIDATSLPLSVDNSKLPSFPPIGDQQQLSSCVAWGTTYYQASHEFGLLNGTNNKNASESVFSPKWTYNLLNNGVDDGLDIFSAYQLFSCNGFATINNFPYDSNYLQWPTDGFNFTYSTNFRMHPGKLVSGIDGTTKDVAVIKQLLANGHVLTMGTFVDSWVMGKVGENPNGKSPHAGEHACLYMNGTDGGHCMTIVGYDDTMWIDVNGDGKVQPGELGAFLVANSWNTTWGNNGFIWVSYDAFRSHSLVPNMPVNRVPLASAMNNKVVTTTPIAQNYAPKVVGTFTLTKSVRDQINVSIGVSDTNTTTPTHIIPQYALKNQGGAFEFDGTSAVEPESNLFTADFTDLLGQIAGTNYRFYLIVHDNTPSDPAVVQSFTLVDLTREIYTDCKQLPETCNKGSVTAFVDYQFLSANAKAVFSSVNITWPEPYATVTESEWVTANVQSGGTVDHVEFYVDSKLVSTDTSAPYHMLFNPKNYSEGSHIITVVAYNKDKTSVFDDIQITVAR